MSLKDRINNDLKEAMKARDEAALRALRAIKSAILLEETSSSFNGSMTEAQEIALLQKQAKQRKESIEVYEKNGRNDLAENEKAELAVIEKYLPAKLSLQEVEQVLKDIISEVGAKSTSDMGKVMGVATKKLAGQADGKQISEIVKRLLS
ncbi:MAG: GatB/YqeY domain-containing protein [Bacteroidia bacterium]|nr:GatB/YqeY domain-containing protein [Bacteroidia bacterium]